MHECIFSLFEHDPSLNVVVISKQQRNQRAADGTTRLCHPVPEGETRRGRRGRGDGAKWLFHTQLMKASKVMSMRCCIASSHSELKKEKNRKSSAPVSSPLLVSAPFLLATF